MKKKKIKKYKKQKGQTLPLVIIIAAFLSIFATALLFLFQQENKFLVKHIVIMKKQILASIALEHAKHKLLQGTNWYNIPISGFKYDKEYTVEGVGKYTIYILKGNLFLNDLTDESSREGQDEYRTIGIKVKETNTNDIHQYYAVVKKFGLGGPLISKGEIDLPCTDDAANNEYYNAYWGDIFSGNPEDGKVKIPVIGETKGDSYHQEWLPHVYAKGNIYTAINARLSGRSVDFDFGYTYNDMSPNSHCHPYSEYANVPDIDLETFKKLAHDNDAYYGPQFINGSPNPYYINDGNHDLSDLDVNAVVNHLSSRADVLFVDTTNGLPVYSGTPSNTYCGTVNVSSSTLKIYTNDSNQFYTRGTFIILGPLVLLGDDPDAGMSSFSGWHGYNPDDTNSDVTNVQPPNNYYYPQDDANHYDYNPGNPKNCKLTKVKHAGILYVDGELKIGGTRTGCGGGGRGGGGTCPDSDLSLIHI